ncbi:hypothetical protein BDY19DRAFT_963156 [Irpex rosettiformis]|uniref:Uncharacterized protein n=1 Tax=Irpex rosettiformis TaxID=378272 RepID=A0ACB8TVR7_9APHY|nr:hypothetical protein BDY19DRAFT_963156 [Irpex rosettiformis]
MSFHILPTTLQFVVSFAGFLLGFLLFTFTCDNPLPIRHSSLVDARWTFSPLLSLILLSAVLISL